MVLRELLLEDEHVVHVREDAMEVGREQVRLHFLAHLSVARPVQLLYLCIAYVCELAFTLWHAVVDVLHVLHLQEEGHVWVETTLLQEVVMRLLKVPECLVILDESAA